MLFFQTCIKNKTRIIPDSTILNPPRAGPLAGFRNSNPAGSGFGEKLFWDHRTMHPMKVIAVNDAVSCYKNCYAVHILDGIFLTLFSVILI